VQLFAEGGKREFLWKEKAGVPHWGGGGNERGTQSLMRGKSELALRGEKKKIGLLHDILEKKWGDRLNSIEKTEGLELRGGVPLRGRERASSHIGSSPRGKLLEASQKESPRPYLTADFETFWDASSKVPFSSPRAEEERAVDLKTGGPRTEKKGGLSGWQFFSASLSRQNTPTTKIWNSPLEEGKRPKGACFISRSSSPCLDTSATSSV